MKQLKFMLAAATAIGLAAAAQAATTTAIYTVGTAADAPENFNADDLQGKNPVDVMDGYSFVPTAPATTADNESLITNQVLNVNTGTDPLLRALDYSSTANDINLANVDSLYINTKVQFTVTPIGDSVTVGDTDKLMIYLQQTNEVVVVEEQVVTNTVEWLMVKAGVPVVDEVTGEIDTVNKGTFHVSAEDLTVVPNQWYTLKVYAEKDAVNGLTIFQIFIDGKQLKVGYALMPSDTTGIKFPSMTGIYDKDVNPKALSLTYVGFAGEGKVDDLLVWTEKVVTGIDFTLAVTGASAVWTTIGGVQYNLDNGKIVLPPGTKSFTLEYTPVAVGTYWNPQYAATLTVDANCTVDGLVVTLGEGAPSATLAVTAAEGESAPKVDENTTASSVGITGGAFDKATSKELQNVLDWAVAQGKNKTFISQIAPFKEGTGEATNLVQEAYLLDCADTEQAVAAKKLQFVFPAIVPGQVPSIDSGFTYNGTLTIKGATTLGVWKDIVDGKITVDSEQKDPTFFKAFLTK